MITPANINEYIVTIEEGAAVFYSCNLVDRDAIATWKKTLTKIQEFIIQNPITLLENHLIPSDLSDRVVNIQNMLITLEQNEMNPSRSLTPNIGEDDVELAAAIQASLAGPSHYNRIDEAEDHLKIVQEGEALKNQTISQFIDEQFTKLKEIQESFPGYSFEKFKILISLFKDLTIIIEKFPFTKSNTQLVSKALYDELRATLAAIELQVEIERPIYEKSERLSHFLKTIDTGINDEIDAGFNTLIPIEQKELISLLNFRSNMLAKYDGSPSEPFTKWRTRQAVYNPDKTKAALKEMMLTLSFDTFQNYHSNQDQIANDVKEIEAFMQDVTHIPNSLPSTSTSLQLHLTERDFDDFLCMVAALVNTDANDPLIIDYIQQALCRESQFFNFKDQLSDNFRLYQNNISKALIQTCREYALEGKKYASVIGNDALEKLFDQCLVNIDQAKS